MCKRHSTLGIMSAITVLVFGYVSCTKNLSSTGTTSSSSSTTTSATIAVAIDSSGDSIYVLQSCPTGYFRDTIAVGNLPSGILSYLDSNYSGFTFEKAFVIKDSAGTIGGYVAIILYNSKPVALLFDASAGFVQVLEQMQKGDMNGGPQGERYQNRDGRQKDTIAISALPSVIQSYFATNYPQDTLIKAYQNLDSTYLVISSDNGIFASLFKSDGNFIKRVELTAPEGLAEQVAQGSLPAAILSYLTATYPDYVFLNAISVLSGSTLQGYIVAIDADNTKYAVVFDASGSFVSVQVLW